MPSASECLGCHQAPGITDRGGQTGLVQMWESPGVCRGSVKETTPNKREEQEQMWTETSRRADLRERQRGTSKTKA